MKTLSRHFVRRPAAWAASLLVCGSFAATAAQPTEWAPSRLIVMQRAGLPPAELAKILKPHGGQAKRLGKSDLYVVQLPSHISETAVVNVLSRNPHLKFAELDYKVRPALMANDPYLGSSWQVPKINAQLAWDVSQGAGVTVAILDSGVLGNHQDLIPNLVPGWNAYDGSSVTGDVTGHGTAVAGSAAAALNNGVGIAGVAGAAKIMPIRITDSAGTAYYSTIANGLTYAADRGVRVANCSYGYLYKNSSVQSAASYLKSKGGLLVVSAGNNGVNESASATSSMIVVSATDGSDAMASWSSFGDMVTVAAPGVGIWTTSADGTYRSASGTSFASPIVAGVVAVMMSANPSLSPSQVQSLLQSTAVDLGATGWDTYYGYGRVDAYAAVAAARNSAATDTQAPSVAIASPAGGATVGGMVTVDVSASDNIGVTRVELRVNGSTVAADTVAPYGFSWDSTTAVNGSATLTAMAYDAAGNSRTSSSVAVSVANNVASDTTAPVVTITNPADGATVTGVVAIRVSASDDSGADGIRQSLYLDNVLKASSSGGNLSLNWNTKKSAKGTHTLRVVAQDAAGNTSSSTVQVTRK